MLDRAAIAARIPHQGSMCLLDAVLAWDSGQIHCRASSHRQPDNPLRAAARRGAACGIEYAAQAMAVHGALLAPAGAPPRGEGWRGDASPFPKGAVAPRPLPQHKNRRSFHAEATPVSLIKLTPTSQAHPQARLPEGKVGEGT